MVRLLTNGVAVLLLAGTAYGQTCPCNGDVDDSGVTNVVDVQEIAECVEGDCTGCVNDCDVDCDGTIDHVDLGVATCQAGGATECCGRPEGACDDHNRHIIPPCIVTSEIGCTLNNGTYHGDGSICDGDNPVMVPAVSTWGLAVMLLALAVVGSVLIIKRRPVAA